MTTTPTIVPGRNGTMLVVAGRAAEAGRRKTNARRGSLRCVFIPWLESAVDIMQNIIGTFSGEGAVNIMYYTY